MKKLIPIIAIISALFINASAQTFGDAALARTKEQDKLSRDASGKLQTLAASEHLLRAEVYFSNRVFPQAREHWAKVIENYPQDAGMARAYFGMGRSNMWERKYAEAIPYFDLAVKNYPFTKDGRESLAFKGACLVRLGKNLEAAKTYEQYTSMFPTGEKIESSYLNIIDAYREARAYDQANLWVDKTVQRFSGLPSATNALFARLRMEMFQQNWQKAANTSDQIRAVGDFSGSMTSLNEITFLKAFALEKMGRKQEAIALYSAMPSTLNSYYGGLASERLGKLGGMVRKTSSVASSEFPAPYRTELLRHAKSRGVDPRFVLAIMKQESSFRANAKSPSAARGLLQLVYDTAIKYKVQAGYPNLQAEDLYKPEVNIALGSIYMAELKKEFGGLYEAIAASYNGGEDNALRWLNRTNPKEAPIFAAEVGFAESKDYVYKVMGNYRVYKELYTEDLRRK